MPSEVVTIEGLDELNRAFRKSDAALSRELRRELKAVGDIVSDDERDYLGSINASRKSRTGIRSQVRGTTVSVRERYGTVSGRRGDWGARIMSSLAKARSRRRPEIEDRLEQMLDRIGRASGF